MRQPDRSLLLLLLLLLLLPMAYWHDKSERENDILI
jgi:hypothetical protein